MTKILVTGGSGLLGGHILALESSLISPSHSEMDITDKASVEMAFDKYQPDTVLHLAAATKPPEHEKTPAIGIENNIIGTANVALAALKRNVRMVYTSTDYLYSGKGPHTENEPMLPPYKFAWSKLGGESCVALLPNSLILRLSFGPRPFPWEKVYKDQLNSKLYVDEIAPLVLALAQGSEVGIMNVGGPRNTLEEYARRTKPNIETIEKPEWVPADTSLDISRMCDVLGITDAHTLLKHYIL
ncbi:MAG: ligand-binding protein, RmlD family [Parcubacteria group bacterium Gr01-1014_8]|nr:MAG: ligand-binding protein, RmlD family [Parcubacteria group bacterium Gr01-1014_8]